MNNFEKHKLETILMSPPDTGSFAVISPCFYKKDQEMELESKALFDAEKIKYITYGKGEIFTNKVDTNLLQLYKILDEIEIKYKVVLIMDVYDTLYLGGTTLLMLISKYMNISKEDPFVVFATEKECYPSGSDIFYVGNNQKPERYLNSGLIMGRSNLIKVMIREMIYKYDLQRFEGVKDDALSHNQIYWHRYYNDGRLKQHIYLDKDSSMFYCMDSCDPYLELEFINPLRLRVKKTDTYPKIFHFNRCFNDKYKQFFGEFWYNSMKSKGLE